MPVQHEQRAKQTPRTLIASFGWCQFDWDEVCRRTSREAKPSGHACEPG